MDPELVNRIYECSVVPELWPGVLDELESIVDGSGGSLYIGKADGHYWKGERHTVTVVANGFVWREATYASLSTIAQAITGTNWNGPRFFGLRIDKEMAISPNGRTPAQAASSKSQRTVARGRPSGNAAPAHPSLGDGGYGR